MTTSEAQRHAGKFTDEWERLSALWNRTRTRLASEINFPSLECNYPLPLRHGFGEFIHRSHDPENR